MKQTNETRVTPRLFCETNEGLSTEFYRAYEDLLHNHSPGGIICNCHYQQTNSPLCSLTFPNLTCNHIVPQFPLYFILFHCIIQVICLLLTRVRSKKELDITS